MNNVELIEINLSINREAPDWEPSETKSTPIAENSAKAQKTEKISVGQNTQSAKSEERESRQVKTPSMDDLVEKVQQYVNTFNTKLSFSFDEEHNRPIIYVIDKETDEVIRQIPPKKMFKLINNLEEIRGIIFQGQA